ncbi:P-loop containing nucleoside triphosphate hydrolase protein [Aspergillus costaricaensis CBS 115574]|uniref:P-loop containing nucleoside triphosphate hydrolase protein n=1 Tax=Aspergillus costaricaensis CBS 115574 TaxID=1448317 RepID=A0ACD1IP00_9EURO|nr:P-loop containing nucleoside triphosphate hydrolase protein [Aspergillus costaricaensis CBS 115574]RAK91440.1 P-loop containing nucleoside triphosphate hydrolase protein [Aspergillus costaricaensis CBS 115574]
MGASVRSFDNTRSETIQFHTPLTLIVGYNGSGKTTIIECLKYATTGDLPPNSKGGAFIHDPKLCGEKEVLAQMVATRSLQLTGQLLMVKDGERTSISSRVAELDQIMPQYLGVSKAILDSVIFCHQDESLWPMSEPSYTKAIDNIKSLRKKQNEELAKYKIMEQHAKEDKEKADRAEKRSIKLQDEIEALREETHQLSQEMRRESESYSQVLGALEGKRIEAKSIRTTIDNLKRHLSNLEQFESRQLQYQQQEEAKKENYMELKEQIEQTRQRLGVKQAEYGKFENDKANFERQVERRQRMTKEVARAHNIRGYDNVEDQADVDEFMRRVRKILKDQNLALERVKKEAQNELRDVQATLNQIGQQKSALQESKNAAKRQIASNDREAATYQGKLNEINVDEGVQAALESNIEDIGSRLDQAKERARSASWDKEIQNVNSQIRDLEDESSRLNTELIEATKKAGDLARLDHLKKELKERERGLETMKGAHGERLTKFVNANWSPESLEQDYQHVIEEESRHVSRAERERDGVSRELEQVEFRMKGVKKTLSQRQKELKECIKVIRDAVDDEPEEYPEILKERQAQLDLARKDAEQYAGVSKYMADCLDTVKSASMCRLCMRTFRTENELQTFKNKLEGLVKRAKRDLNTAREASTAYDTWCQEEDQLEENDKIVSEKADKKKDVESFEIKSIRSQVQDLSSKQHDTNASRTLEDIQDEIAGIGEKSRALKKTLSKLTHEKEQTLDVKSNLDNVKFKLERKADLLARIEEYKNLNNQQREAIAKADKEIEDLTPELLKRAEAREKDMQQEISHLYENIHQLELANEEIDAYNERGGPHQLERSKRELQSIEDEISNLEIEQANITKEINKISAQLKDSENTKRQYADNLTYRQATRSLDAVTEEIEQLAAQNAEVDRSRFKEESERRAREHNALAAKQASKMGEMKGKDDQLMQLLADWNTDYKDAASKYKEAHIKVETTKAAVDDLARYGGALDKAIMKYHGLKMEEINAIISELWQKTYRGTDVDTILIRSDNENAKGNRSYNYRVCMVKQGAEMDMRGRCSAGQKVLASIIIRLALAECFGVNCGLIALDEPTTNLDRDNIRSLAESLHDIIRTRQQQANFQLIVITHDEEFLRHMQCGDFSDYYYRVSRNEKQKSIIERQSIAELSSHGTLHQLSLLHHLPDH